MQSKIKNIFIKILFPLVFWLVFWQIGAFLVSNSYFLPTPAETFRALLKIIPSEEFLSVTLQTVSLVIEGLFFGTLFGIIFSISAHKFSPIHALLSPALSVIKATPVASIIILVWISPMKGHQIASFIAFLMVFPIIYQNLYDAFSSIDRDLSELATSFEFSYKKRLKILIFPKLREYFIPAFITSVGLAFKSEIATEIIAGVRNSIGQMIYHSKDAYDTASVFAWTLVGVFFSIILEKIAKYLLGSFDKKTSEVRSK